MSESAQTVLEYHPIDECEEANREYRVDRSHDWKLVLHREMKMFSKSIIAQDRCSRLPEIHGVGRTKGPLWSTVVTESLLNCPVNNP